jgi:hypothetical protein
VTDDARLWHPWLRINRVLRVMLHALEHGGVAQVKAEFTKALALNSRIRRAGWFGRGDQTLASVPRSGDRGTPGETD